MKLQDYIHYYIGCKVENYDIYGLELPTLKGVRGDQVILSEYKCRTEDCKDYLIAAESYEFAGVAKPILRRLESLTRDEMKDIWQLIFGRPFPDSGNIIWFDKEDRRSCKRWVMMSGVERVGIELNGNVWADSDLSHHKFTPGLVTHYLLTKHFDLFVLIDAGLAIEAKPVNA